MRRIPSLAVGIVALALLGCRDESTLPSAPSDQPSPAVATAAALTFRQVSGGWVHACGVTTDDRAYCWGANWAGQLGDGTRGRWPDYVTNPVAVAGKYRFRSVSAGYNHTCGITLGSVVYCWGGNFNGELGDGTTAEHLVPTRVASSVRMRQVSAGVHRTCAVSEGDIAYCWGSNAYGAIGDGSSTERWTPVRVSGARHFLAVSTGYFHTCGVTTDSLGFCWGLAAYGQLGDGGKYHNQRLRPVPVAGGLAFRQIRAGYFHTCGITTSRRAYCWGNNGRELGSPSPGDKAYQTTPRAVAGGLAFRQVDASYYHTCGVTTRNAAYCWGGESGVPALVPGGLALRQISTGFYTNYGVTTDALAYSWSGDTGEPAPVPGPE